MLELFKHHRKLSKKYVPKPPYFLDFFQICCRKSNFSFCDVPKAVFSARRPPRRFDLSAESVKSPTFASFAGTKKTMIVITIAFVSCLVWVCLRLPDANAPLLWLRSGMERYADRKLSLCCQFFVSGFVGLLTDPFMRVKPCSLCDRVRFLRKRIASAFSPGHDSPSNDRFSPRADCSVRKTML